MSTQEVGELSPATVMQEQMLARLKGCTHSSVRNCGNVDNTEWTGLDRQSGAVRQELADLSSHCQKHTFHDPPKTVVLEAIYPLRAVIFLPISRSSVHAHDLPSARVPTLST